MQIGVKIGGYSGLSPRCSVRVDVGKQGSCFQDLCSLKGRFVYKKQNMSGWKKTMLYFWTPAFTDVNELLNGTLWAECYIRLTTISFKEDI